MKQVKFQLKNKMKVILVPSHKSPVVSVQMWVKTGSADEKKGEEGISHFIEHLVFKGTQKYKVGEIASIVEASGGELNAYTSFDQTVFYVTISKNDQEVALDVISQMMGFPTFIKEEVDSEREVVCEEIKMGIDSPSRQSSQLLFKSMFQKHTYGKPVIGYDKNVRSWSVKKLKDYFSSRYVPSNMTLIVAGDFETPQMKKFVHHYFAGFIDYKLRKIKREQEPKTIKNSFVVQSKEIQETTFNIAFKAPHAKHKDVLALDALLMVLGQGETSRLFRLMRLESHLVNTISSYAYNPIDTGLLTISFKVQEQDPLKAAEVIGAELLKIRELNVTEAELSKAKTILLSDQFYNSETVDGIAQKVGGSEFYFGDSKAHEKFLKKVQQLKVSDLKKSAQKYLIIKDARYSALGPKNENELKSTLKAIHKILTKALSLKKGLPLASSHKSLTQKEKQITLRLPKAKHSNKSESLAKIKLKNNSEIISYPMRELPTASIKMIFGGGSRIETKQTQGMSELLSRIWLGATKNKSENQILNVIEESAAGLNVFNGRNTLGFSIEYMKFFENKILDLTQELIFENELKEEIFEREKESLLRQIKTKEDQPGFLCGRQFTQAMFKDHPVSFESLGNLETIQNISLKDLIAYQHKILFGANTLTVAVGDFDIKQISNLSDQLKSTNQWNEKKRLLQKIEFKKIEKSQRLFLDKDKEQSHVMVGWGAFEIGHHDRFVLHVIQAILAGQGGRLFVELRDKNSLAYSVSPVRMESLECGYFGGYIACSPDKVEKALEMFHIEFKKMTRDVISKEELMRAQKYLIGQNDIGLQRKASICNTIAFDDFYGINFKESLDIADKYLKVTVDDVLRVSKQLFTQNYIESIVGRKIK